MSLRESVAAGVRARLAWQRISARKAALELGWSEPYMSRRLVGSVPFDVSDLEQLAGLLDLPVTAFFEEPFAREAATTRGSRNQHLARHAWELAA